jgi:hypothetical protein
MKDDIANLKKRVVSMAWMLLFPNGAADEVVTAGRVP